MLGSAKHLEALAYAAAGIPVFPCVVNGKEPACEHGYKDATTDVEQINAWWAQEDFNLAIVPNDAGWCVVDLDPGGLDTWDNLCREHGGQIRTATVRTPRGGSHFYFLGSLPPTASKLGSHIDTRGVGSYVLVPPSSIDGVSYEWQAECETQTLPAWIAEAVAAKTDKLSTAVEELDTPAAIARARARLTSYVERGDVAREGHGGDTRTYMLSAEMVDLGLSPDTALDLIDEIWNCHCVPPWTRDELSVKIENASRYMQNEAGAYGVVSAQEAFGSTLDKLKATTPDEPTRRSKFYPITLAELPTALREPSWLVPGLIPEHGTVQIVGKQKSFKTFLTLDLALGIASGTTTFGCIPEQRPVVYAVGENASAFGLRHVPAWRVARGVDTDFPFYTVAAVPRALINEETYELVEQIKKRGITPGVVVIDTATRALRGLDENSARDMGLFSEACDVIRTELHCTVIAIRHTGKDQARGGRGSNVLEGDFDTILEVERPEKSMAVALHVKEQRNAMERDTPFTFEGKPIGQSLAFFPISLGAYSQYVAQNNSFAPKNIGKALVALGARGREKGVVTPVLAAQLIVPDQGETQEQRQEALGRACKGLNALSRTKLQAYCERLGREALWFLPAD